MSSTDEQIILGYIVAIFVFGFFITFALALAHIWPDRERTVTCTVGNHPVSSSKAWYMDGSLTGKYHWLCNDHIHQIYPHASGDIR